MKIAKKNLYMALAGAGVGLINGFFGGGGGMVVLPLLTILFGYEQKNAHATAIAVILPVTVVSAVAYVISGGFSAFNLDMLWTTLGVIAGGVIGALLLKKISNAWLVKIFALVMLIAGVKLVWTF